MKLGDFGIAKAAGVEADARSGFVKGTYGYSAPEQVTGKEVTPRADVYSAGMILWELLARRKAVQRGGLNDAQVQKAMAHPEFPALELLRPDLDAAVRAADPPDARARPREADHHGGGGRQRPPPGGVGRGGAQGSRARCHARTVWHRRRRARLRSLGGDRRRCERSRQRDRGGDRSRQDRAVLRGARGRGGPREDRLLREAQSAGRVEPTAEAGSLVAACAAARGRARACCAQVEDPAPLAAARGGGGRAGGAGGSAAPGATAARREEESLPFQPCRRLPSSRRRWRRRRSWTGPPPSPPRCPSLR